MSSFAALRMTNSPHEIEALITIQGSFAAAAALLGFGAKVFLPHIRRILAFAAMFGNARVHTANHGRIDSRSSNDYLPFRKGRQVIQEIAPNPLDSGGHTFLVNFVHNTHDTLRLALAEHIGIEFTRTLTD